MTNVILMKNTSNFQYKQKDLITRNMHVKYKTLALVNNKVKLQGQKEEI